jgi:hypothetical protein
MVMGKTSVNQNSRLILLLGGTVWNALVAQRLKRRGWIVATVDENPTCDSTVFGIPNYVCSMTDARAVLQISESLRPSLVLADSTDRAVRTVGVVNDALQLPGISEEIAIRFTNKHQMRERLVGIVEQPTFNLLPVELLKRRLLNYVPTKRKVLKQLEGQSSQGVFSIENSFDLDKAIKFFEKNRLKNVLEEDWVGGQEYTVDSLTIDGVTAITAISRKKQYPDNPLVSRALYFDLPVRGNEYLALATIHQKAVNGLGMRDGLCHGEYKIDDSGRAFLIEIAARGGGTGISAVIAPFLSTFDIHACLIKHLVLKDKVHFERIQWLELAPKCAALVFTDARPMPITSISYGKMPSGLLWINHRNITSGFVPTFEDDAQRNKSGFFIVGEDCKELLDDLVNKVEDCIEINYG